MKKMKKMKNRKYREGHFDSKYIFLTNLFMVMLMCSCKENNERQKKFSTESGLEEIDFISISEEPIDFSKILSKEPNAEKNSATRERKEKLIQQKQEKQRKKREEKRTDPKEKTQAKKGKERGAGKKEKRKAIGKEKNS